MSRVRMGAVALVVALVAGCASTTAPPSGGVDSAPPRPLNVQDPAVVPSAAPAPTCDPRASLRPLGAIPAAGRMPAGSSMARIAKRGRLIVGIDQNAYLFGYRDPATGTLVGFEIDLAKEIAKALLGNPAAIQFRYVTTADRIPAIQRGDVDMVIREMTMTCDRWQQISFSSQYLSSHQRVLVNRGAGIRSLADLAHRKVCASKGSTSIRLISQASSHPIPVSTASTLDCLVLLQQGEVDAVSTDDTLLLGLAAQDPGTELVGPPLSDEPYGIGIAQKSPDLVRFVNAVLARLRADGTWQRIYARWLSGLGAAKPPVARYRA